MHQELGDILNTPSALRTSEQSGDLNRRIRECATAVCTSADVVFTTCITATSKWLRPFKKNVKLVILDEGGAVTLAETLLVWRGDTPLVIVGDDNAPP